jgi:hypothetical protein
VTSLGRRQYGYLLAGFVVAAVLAASGAALVGTAPNAFAVLAAVSFVVDFYCSAWVAADWSDRANQRFGLPGFAEFVRSRPMSRERFSFFAGISIYLAALVAIWTLTTIVFIFVPIVMFRP